MSVDSVGLALPAIFSVTGSPVTSTGTLEGDLVTQSANTVFAGPASGADATPTFRGLTSADLPIATATTLGIVSVGSGLTVDGGVLSANAQPAATSSSLGVISVGSGLTVDGSGLLSANAPAVATTTSLGVVSVGSGLSVSGGGLLSANAPAIATATSLGVVSVGSGLTVNGSGVLSANAPAVATAASLGVVSVGSGLTVNGSGVLSANAPAVATTGSVGVVSVGSGLSVTPSGVLSRSTSYSVGVPALSSFTKVNQGSCVTSEVPGASLTVIGTGSAASSWNNFVMYKAAPTAPYRLAAYFSISSSIFPYLGGGLGFYDPSTTKYVEVFICWNLNNVCNIQVSKWNSPTSFNATPVTWLWSMTTSGFWLGLRDDGTNVYYEFSADGANYITIYQEAKASGFLSSYAINALIANLSNATSSRVLNMTVFVWDINGLSRTPTIL
jgi:hypothetical protein